jgi:polar amino acid transport system substrate-binding protein
MTISGNIRLLALASALLASVIGTAAAETMGGCEVSGQKGQFKISPLTPGVLTVRANLPAPGWWNGNTPDDIKDGFEYCLAQNIAYRAGLDRVQVVIAAWTQVLSGAAKNFDLTLSQASITEPRKKTVDFSVPYFDSNIGVVVKKGLKVDSASIKKMRLGVYVGTTGATYVADTLKPEQEVKAYPNVPAMMAALSGGQIDVAIDDLAYMLGYAKKSNGLFEAVGQYKTGEQYGAIYPKGSPNGPELDKDIQSLIDDGTVAKLEHKYLLDAWGTDPSSVPMFQP